MTTSLLWRLVLVLSAIPSVLGPARHADDSVRNALRTLMGQLPGSSTHYTHRPFWPAVSQPEGWR